MPSYLHLGHLVASHRGRRAASDAELAAVADVLPQTWRMFERTGRHVGPERIGRVVEHLGIRREELRRLADPLAVLGTVWGPGLGALLRERRGDLSLAVVARRSGVSSATVYRWERAVTRPRDAGQLAALLGALGVDAVVAVELALWPPRSMMVERPPLGAMLLERREARGLTSRQAASVVGVVPGTYNAWERGRGNPSPKNVPAVAAFLGVEEALVERTLVPRRVDTFGLDDTARILVDRRRRQFESLAAAASRSGLTRGQLAGYETGGRKVPAVSVPKLADALRMDAFAAALLVDGVSAETATIGQLLRAARRSRGLTQRRAALRLGTNRNSLVLWESDRMLPRRAATRERLVTSAADAYGLASTDVRAALERTGRPVDPFGAWLAAQVDAAGLRGSEVSRRLGLSTPTVGSWCRGAARPSARHAEPLARILGIPARDVRSRLAEPYVRPAA